MYGQHRNLDSKWGSSGVYHGRHRHLRPAHRRGIWGLCLLLPVLVYGLIAFLPRAGLQGGQRTAYSVGGVGSHDNSGGHRMGNLEDDGQDRVPLGGDWYISHIRGGIRVHDGAPGVRRVAAKPVVQAATVTIPPGHDATPAPPTTYGTYDCGQLESLWDEEGGNPGEAVTAASVAMAESGGQPSIVSSTDDVGLWQVNAPSWGAMASTSPAVNARSAITISDDGANWTPWTTYTSGAYYGRC